MLLCITMTCTKADFVTCGHKLNTRTYLRACIYSQKWLKVQIACKECQQETCVRHELRNSPLRVPDNAGNNWLKCLEKQEVNDSIKFHKFRKNNVKMPDQFLFVKKRSEDG